jgi:phospholipid/cholesterol/gamma-HCH transport system permease protein
MGATDTERKASLTMREDGTASLIVSLSGRLDSITAGDVWQEAVGKVKSGLWEKVIVEAEGLEYVDGAGIGLLIKLKALQISRGATIDIQGLKAKFKNLLDMYDEAGLLEAHTESPARKPFFEKVGGDASRIIASIKGLISFTGESFAALTLVFTRPGKVRWKDVLLLAEKVGADGLPIIALIGFLMGLIMAFQSAITLKRFGAEIFVANLLGLSMFRELGPLVTCILLAGRSGSAFAAELGTMKIKEEIDALNTMGLSPIRFLVTSRVLAALGVTPLLTLFFNLCSLVGGAVVMLSMGYPLATYTSRVFSSIQMTDFLGGIFKAAVFSVFVAGIGCQRGLSTRTGASAVGDSTTSAVVSGIIFIAVLDGIFAVIYYYLEI